MQEQSVKRGPGRPRKAIKEKRQHVDITLSLETVAYLESLQPMNISRFIDTLIREHQAQSSEAART